MQVEDLDTPVLIVDLDALEENVARYRRYFEGHRIAFRPHIKTHKTLALAHRQMAEGAIGITCQKLGEVEVMVAGGLRTDTLVPYNLVGRQKLDRLTALARQTRMTVAADSEYTVRGLSEAAHAGGVSIGVLVELDAVGGRTGVSPQRAVELGRLIDALPGLELRGVMGFPTPPKTRPLFQEALDLFDRAGLPHPVVSGGSTKCAFQAHEVPEFTEYRAGEYLVGGAGHMWGGTHTVAQCALRVITTVVSRPAEGRAILDGGSKSLSATFREGSMGHLVEYPDARFYGASEEHGHVDVSACAQKPEIGERVQVIPVHPCPCVNEHDELVAVRKGRVEAVWPIYARGKVR
ncbi:MAG: D-TA family PLP-dependent enzyme [Candidatus Latescibacteria bacterium]|nr:D-TA family PLP-dependent enzyme [Candidatus Latescibacterota bacterium]